MWGLLVSFAKLFWSPGCRHKTGAEGNYDGKGVRVWQPVLMTVSKSFRVDESMWSSTGQELRQGQGLHCQYSSADQGMQ